MLLFALLLVGLNTTANAANDCLQSRSALLNCVDQNSPELKGSRLTVERSQAQEAVAGQWLNPAFSMNSLSGSAGGLRNSETDFNLGIPLELGGKISARKDVAKAATRASEAGLFGARIRLRVESLLNLNRYRQALHEKEAVDEAVRSFSQLIEQFNGRLRLSPEQATSLAVYKMARNEYQLRSNSYSNEIANLQTYFRINAGIDAEDITRLLPPETQKWPELGDMGDLTRGPRIRELDADVLSAEAELRSARSLSWPTLSVGPSARLQDQGGTKATLWGFNLGVAVPIFNSNGAGRAAAAANLQLGQAVKELGLDIQRNERVRAEQVYRRSVESVKGLASHSELEKAHRAIDQNFSRGLVPSALIIEAHRTYVELERSRNERELSALRALYEVYTIDGSILEKTQ